MPADPARPAEPARSPAPATPLTPPEAVPALPGAPPELPPAAPACAASAPLAPAEAPTPCVEGLPQAANTGARSSEIRANPERTELRHALPGWAAGAFEGLTIIVAQKAPTLQKQLTYLSRPLPAPTGPFSVARPA